MRRESVGCLTKSSSAARVMPPARATTTDDLNALISEHAPLYSDNYYDIPQGSYA